MMKPFEAIRHSTQSTIETNLFFLDRSWCRILSFGPSVRNQSLLANRTSLSKRKGDREGAQWNTPNDCLELFI